MAKGVLRPRRSIFQGSPEKSFPTFIQAGDCPNRLSELLAGPILFTDFHSVCFLLCVQFPPLCPVSSVVSSFLLCVQFPPLCPVSYFGLVSPYERGRKNSGPVGLVFTPTLAILSAVLFCSILLYLGYPHHYLLFLLQ